ncbi:MAG: response regulator [Spirochaetaceae bacterium]|jgi:signal transduction histidine kinase/HPt (histidine-containing phosphotransfer) domain-containing protein|nr:response regulator [Spirochaetaceae bacterium]
MDWTRFWTVDRKITAGFLLGTIVTLVVGIMGFVSVQTMDNSLSAMGKAHFPRNAALEDLDNLRLKAELTLAEVMLTQNKIDRIERLQIIQQERENLFTGIDDTWSQLQNLHQQNESGLFEILQNEYRFWRIANSMLDRYLQMLLATNTTDSLDDLFTEFIAVREKTEPVSSMFSAAVGDLRRYNMSLMSGIIAENSELSFETKFRIVCFVLLGIITAIILGIVVTNLITIPVRNALKLLTAMSKGEHIEEIETKSNDEIGQMIRLLQNEVAAKLKAEDSSRSKVEFLAIMSHEIRTPLNAILGLTEVQLQNYSANKQYINAETASAFKKIKDSGKGLLGIVNGVLDISKIEMGKLEFNPRNYDIAYLVNDALQPYRAGFKKKEIEFIVDIDENIPAVLYGDDARIKQILNNLLSNAFKFTERGFVKLEVSSFRLGNGIFVTYTVTDSGIGIKESDISTIFSSFRQLSGGIERRAEGMGLGLAISKQLASLMGGWITCESELGTGSVFTFQIPQRQADEGNIGKDMVNKLRSLQPLDSGESPGKRPGSERRGRALIVDDIETNIDVAKGMVSLYNMDVDGVLSGMEAVERIEAAEPRYDVIFMDQMMPEMNGMEATAIIRALGTEYARNIPIIALTANIMADNEKLFLDAGLNAYLAKPLELEKLDREMVKLGRMRAAPLQLDLENNIFENIHIEGMNFADGLKRFTNQDTYKNIIKSFVQNTPMILDKIKKIIADGHNPAETEKNDYSILVHGIKGSARAIGGELVGKLAEELEIAAKSGNAGAALEKTPHFIRETESLIAGLNSTVVSAGYDSAADIKEARERPDGRLLKMLAAACGNYDVTKIDAIMAELEKYKYREGGDLVEFIREQIDDCEYFSVSEKISSIDGSV